MTTTSTSTRNNRPATCACSNGKGKGEKKNTRNKGSKKTTCTCTRNSHHPIFLWSNSRQNENNNQLKLKQTTMGPFFKLRIHQLLFFASLLLISYSEAFAASTFSPCHSFTTCGYKHTAGSGSTTRGTSKRGDIKSNINIRGGSLSSSSTEEGHEESTTAYKKTDITLMKGFGSTYLSSENGSNGINGFNGKNGKRSNGVNGNTNGVNGINGINGKNNKVNIKRNDIQQPSAKEQLLRCNYVAETNLPTDVGQFRLRAYRIDESDHENIVKNKYVGSEPCVIYSPDKSPFINANGQDDGVLQDVPVRIHDQCFTSEVFRSKRCDCKEQLKLALEYIQKNGGAIIYLQQEGRGIGIANKIAAYSLQDHGLDTVDANTHLGFPEDAREYGVVPTILEDMGIKSIKLMTNNPRKINRLKSLGVDIVDTIPMVVKTNKHNRKYIQTKVDRMHHRNFGEIVSFGNDDEALRELISESVEKLKPKDSASLAEDYINFGEEMAAAAITTALLDDEDTDSDIERYVPQLGVQASDDGYCFGRKSVEDAIVAVARGEIVVVVDDMDRENEGDFIMAADMATPETIAIIVRYSSGVICIGMEGDRMDELKLPAMLENNEDPKGTAFSVTVDASKEHGITTGISATDRAKTMQLLADPSTTASDFARPGHIFPLRARSGGVLERDGHTEAAVDLSRLAGRNPSGVLCEIVSEENPTEMARLPELKRMCKKHGFVLTSIVDIAQYRRDTEEMDQ